MAFISTKKANLIGPSFVLAPERYDPRRSVEAAFDSVLLGEVVTLIRRTVAPDDKLEPCLVLDTSDAREGIVIGRKQQTTEIGSTKKSIQPGDVIVSRLRPYLRQVASVDDGILNLSGANLLCSTEFFVLRSPDERSIAFLVPYLLSDQVQEVLAASQEGGHHPRFDDSTLLTLPVPKKLLDNSKAASAAVEKAIAMYRDCERTIDGLVAQVNTAFRT
jgi:hypothetical protein